MDVLRALSHRNSYSQTELQWILAAWAVSGLVERRKKITVENGDVSESDYDKRSIYSLLYALYRSMGSVKSETGERYEFTFNTWGYAWPESWGPCPVRKDDPQRYGKIAYTGLFQFDAVKRYVEERKGK